MKKILCLLLFVLFALFSVSARENPKIMFKNGKSVLMSDVISKDQFGIMIVCGKDTETGVKLRRFVPFAEMNPASLSLFPFCDVKAVERIHTAVQDRAKLLQVRFAKKYQQFENEKDYTKLLKIHSGVPSYEILFFCAGNFAERFDRIPLFGYAVSSVLREDLSSRIEGRSGYCVDRCYLSHGKNFYAQRCSLSHVYCDPSGEKRTGIR